MELHSGEQELAEAREEIEALRARDLADGYDHLHHWFGLSYAQYLTVPRSVMQEMPLRWRNSMAGLLRELDEVFDWLAQNATYRVGLWTQREVWDEEDESNVTKWDRELHDPLMDYRHNRAAVLQRRKSNDPSAACLRPKPVSKPLVDLLCPQEHAHPEEGSDAS